MIDWVAFHPQAEDMLGYIPSFVSDTDKRPLREQLDSAYRHGGGFRPMEGWTFTPETASITYPGDPALKPVAAASIGDETLFVYPHAWVAIVDKDGNFQIARMD